MGLLGAGGLGFGGGKGGLDGDVMVASSAGLSGPPYIFRSWRKTLGRSPPICKPFELLLGAPCQVPGWVVWFRTGEPAAKRAIFVAKGA